MRYYTYTITDDTGIVKSVEGVPFEDRFKLERRLFDPRPFALDEWTDNAVALYDDEDEDIPPNTDLKGVGFFSGASAHTQKKEPSPDGI